MQSRNARQLPQPAHMLNASVHQTRGSPTSSFRLIDFSTFGACSMAARAVAEIFSGWARLSSALLVSSRKPFKFRPRETGPGWCELRDRVTIARDHHLLARLGANEPREVISCLRDVYINFPD